MKLGEKIDGVSYLKQRKCGGGELWSGVAPRQQLCGFCPATFWAALRVSGHSSRDGVVTGWR